MPRKRHPLAFLNRDEFKKALRRRVYRERNAILFTPDGFKKRLASTRFDAGKSLQELVEAGCDETRLLELCGDVLVAYYALEFHPPRQESLDLLKFGLPRRRLRSVLANLRQLSEDVQNLNKSAFLCPLWLSSLSMEEPEFLPLEELMLGLPELLSAYATFIEYQIRGVTRDVPRRFPLVDLYEDDLLCYVEEKTGQRHYERIAMLLDATAYLIPSGRRKAYMERFGSDALKRRHSRHRTRFKRFKRFLEEIRKQP